MSQPHRGQNLTSGSLLFSNIIWVFFGRIIPIGAAVICIPLLISGLGDAQFGLLSIIWVVMGIAALLDLGLGRAVVKFISEKIDTGSRKEIAAVFGVAWGLILILSLVLLVGIVIFRFQIVALFFEVDTTLVPEAEQALLYTGLILPIVFSNSVFISVLKAYQKFRVITIVTSINSVLNYTLPLLVLLVSSKFSFVVLSIIGLKIIVFVVYLMVLLKSKRWLFNFKRKYLVQELVPIIQFGGWVSVSNLLNPVLDYTDRFMIAAIVSVSAVTYYVTPMDMILKIGGLSLPVVSVLFPAITNTEANNKQRIPFLLNAGMVAVIGISFPAFYFIALFSSEILSVWINENMAEMSGNVLKILSLGFILKTLTYMPYAYLHGSNRPRLVAIIHLTELVAYVLILWLLLIRFGIVGAAMAYSFRALLDFILLSVFADRVMDGREVFRAYYLEIGVLLLIFSSVFFSIPIILKFLILCVVALLFSIYVWKLKLTREMKEYLLKKTKII